MPVPVDDPILVAPSPTPFRDDDAVDYSAIEANVGRWLDTPLSGFVLNTENGEESFLSERERLEIVRTVNRARDGRKFIIGGVDNPSVTETLRTAEALAEAGAELVRVRIPRLTSNVRGYFEQVIPRAAAPVVIIHQPAPGTFLGGAMSLGTSAELVAELIARDNVFGYIMSADLRFETRVRSLAPENNRFWTGNGSLLLTGAVLGANGGCLMLANVASKQCRDIIQFVMQGRLADARELQASLLEADWQILSRGAAGLKAALDLLGYRGGPPRAPMLPCDAETIERIRTALHAAELT